MSDEPASRLSIIWSPIWSPEARADLRRIDGRLRSISSTALIAISSRAGDTQAAADGVPASLRRLRVYFEHGGELTVEILGVRHRREAYR